MLRMRRQLACCSWGRGISIDFDEHDKVMTYNGLGSCILNSQSYEHESRTSRDDEYHTESFNEDESSISTASSSKDGSGSVSSKWLTVKRTDKEELGDWEALTSPQHFYVKEKPPLYAIQHADVETMKEKFAKLLLGEDHSGGCRGISTALALSNAITSLAAMVFGELWKLEPLSEERKSRWRREMEWFLSPTKYMVELVPAKQSGANGCTLEIMTPKARADIHMNLPALTKLDSMLVEMLETMVNNEFWYAEGGSRAEGRSKNEKRWWLPSPQVPRSGLSDNNRKKLMYQGRLVLQVLKAAKAINESVLLEMSVPTIIKDALLKSGRANLSDKLYKALTAESSWVEDMFDSLKLDSEHSALECINKLETAILAWKEKISGHMNSTSKSPLRTSWSPFTKDPTTELDKTETLLKRAESLIQYLKYRYPNLPQTFLDVTKVKYGKDVGHAIIEAYSRVLGNLAYRILARIRDILQEDVGSDPNSPALSCCYPRNNCSDFFEHPSSSHRIRYSVIGQMNKVDGKFSDSFATTTSSDSETWGSETKMRSVMETPSRKRV